MRAKPAGRAVEAVIVDEAIVDEAIADAADGANRAPRPNSKQALAPAGRLGAANVCYAKA